MCPIHADPLRSPVSNELFEVLSVVRGADLVGVKYEPLFNYFVAEYGATAFRVVADTYVTDDAGTGIVHQVRYHTPPALEVAAAPHRSSSKPYLLHMRANGSIPQAPAFGEDDFRVCAAMEVVDKTSGKLPCPVDANGNFTSEVPEFVGVHVKAADDGICALLKSRGRLVSKATITHSYPFCWRSEVRCRV